MYKCGGIGGSVVGRWVQGSAMGLPNSLCKKEKKKPTTVFGSLGVFHHNQNNLILNFQCR